MKTGEFIKNGDVIEYSIKLIGRWQTIFSLYNKTKDTYYDIGLNTESGISCISDFYISPDTNTFAVIVVTNMYSAITYFYDFTAGIKQLKCTEDTVPYSPYNDERLDVIQWIDDKIKVINYVDNYEIDTSIDSDELNKLINNLNNYVKLNKKIHGLELQSMIYELQSERVERYEIKKYSLYKRVGDEIKFIETIDR